MISLNYIADSIGEGYKEWKSGQYIFIKAPTGSGKTYFILNELVDFAVANNRRVLYLVNRSI